MFWIAIQGDEINGHKIIEYFESLGASNYYNFNGNRDIYYYINTNANIEGSRCKPKELIVYESWEEFEKNYLNKNKMKIAIKGGFKNGHKIIEYFMSLGATNPLKRNGMIDGYYYIKPGSSIIDVEVIKNLQEYKIYKSWEQFENEYLNKNKMEERNIKISLGKAKEWYKQGGDLRQVALQAFSENELRDNFPESWDRYNTLADYKGNRINAGGIPGSADYCHFATKEEAEAFVALGKLIQLRDEYWRLDFNWKPNWLTLDIKYCIRNSIAGIICDTTFQCPAVLSFRTIELRNEFHRNFYNLIEEAKMFL